MMSRVLGALLALFAVAATVAYVRFALAHLHYVGELDYIEGVMLDHVVRIVEGKPLYVAPSLKFITLAYMPAYTFVASLVARVFGVSFFAARLVSALSSFAIAGLVAFIVGRETRSKLFALAAAGLYCMGYGLAGGGHYDVARPDSLMLATSLLAYAILRFTTRPAGAIVSALLLVFAFFTKQHGIWFGFAALAHVAINDRPRLGAFAIPWVVGCAGGYGLLWLWLGPWFGFYTWNLPSHWSTIAPLRIEHYVGGGLLGMLGVLTVSSLASLGLPQAPWKGRDGLWAFLAFAGFGTGMLATLDPSAWRHVFIPSMVAFSVFGPLSLWRLTESFGPQVRDRARGVAFFMLTLQFVPLVYPLHAESPHHGAASAREDFVSELKDIHGPVLVIEHGYYSWLAGKGTGMQQIAFGDLERAPDDKLFREDPNFVLDLIHPLVVGPGRPTLVTDEPLAEVGPLWDTVLPGYRLARDYGERFKSLRGFAGHANWPRYVYEPVDAAAPVAADSTATTGGAPAHP